MPYINYLIIIVSISNLFPGNIKTTSEQYLSSQFSDSANIKMHIFELKNNIKKDIENKVRQRFYRNKLYYWNISHGDSTIAYAFLDNVIGKSMPITFLIILNINGKIITSSVIKYREAYGGDVGNKVWLSQFINKNYNSSYEVGKDIDGISGATISVKSMSKGIQKIVTLYPIIKNQLN